MAYGLEFQMFIAIAFIGTYLSYTLEEKNFAIISSLFAGLFWVTTTWQWFIDQTGDAALIGTVFLFPIGLNLIRFYEILMGMNERSTLKADPFT